MLSIVIKSYSGSPDSTYAVIMSSFSSLKVSSLKVTSLCSWKQCSLVSSTDFLTRDTPVCTRCVLPLRPLQINYLFPVHRPHLVTASSKYFIIPYSSIIFRCILIGSVKAIFNQCQLTCQQCYQVSTNSTFVLF